MPKRISLLSVFLVTVTTNSYAAPLGGPTCPTTWTYGDRTVKLKWAEVWVGWESLPPIEGQTRDGKDWDEDRRGREYDEVFWVMKNFKKPAFLRCRYSNSRAMSEGPDVIVPIPDDSATCHTAWPSAPNVMYVKSISCSPGKAAVPPLSVAEPIGLDTDLEGMKLRRPRNDLVQVVAARGGTWTEGNKAGIAEATFPQKGTRYRIVFSKTTGLSREIAEIGPLPSDRHDFIVSIQHRFGTFSLFDVGSGNGALPA